MHRYLSRLVPRSVKQRLRQIVRAEVEAAQLPPVREIVEVRTHEVREVIERVPTLDDELILGSPQVAAVTVASDPEAFDIAFPDFGPHAGPELDLPVPPQELWTVAEGFLESGERDASDMVAILERCGLKLNRGTRVLDFGCGPGRVLRWLPTEIDGWGIDLNADRIAWCQAALSPPFRFATCGTYPHLPFADGTFRLIYAGSVFTHVAELADAWLLELLRATAPGGLLYLTIHDQASVEFCRARDPESSTRALTGHAQPDEVEARVQAMFDRLGHDLDGFTFGRGYFAQVFYDREALVQHWGRYAEVVTVVPNAFALHQTAVVLRRRREGAIWRTRVPTRATRGSRRRLGQSTR